VSNQQDRLSLLNLGKSLAESSPLLALLAVWRTLWLTVAPHRDMPPHKPEDLFLVGQQP